MFILYESRCGISKVARCFREILAEVGGRVKLVLPTPCSLQIAQLILQDVVTASFCHVGYSKEAREDRLHWAQLCVRFSSCES